MELVVGLLLLSGFDWWWRRFASTGGAGGVASTGRAGGIASTGGAGGVASRTGGAGGGVALRTCGVVVSLRLVGLVVASLRGLAGLWCCFNWWGGWWCRFDCGGVVVSLRLVGLVVASRGGVVVSLRLVQQQQSTHTTRTAIKPTHTTTTINPYDNSNQTIQHGDMTITTYTLYNLLQQQEVTTGILHTVLYIVALLLLTQRGKKCLAEQHIDEGIMGYVLVHQDVGFHYPSSFAKPTALDKKRGDN